MKSILKLTKAKHAILRFPLGEHDLTYGVQICAWAVKGACEVHKVVRLEMHIIL